ncbi:hypothetical protein G6F46_009828 [Rhizopus delemar]|uniref:Uncharacterized protein n=2 Tax=Rhizopus TaxID=4842 RepID=A0A9P6YYH8_9FUNG|nr:hypothetical protein G6F55_009364 [Rhizopus delemar]KAG1537538.1 hypothetical protein G6F51_010312 [Rhizopus arrhizus]KAG1492384.1 hypothetical protein G6F54_009349 [Rhizopus delemar]KAG1507502.1 hypothetical protein G6F53_008901 [Rhizopus delemar]KAG1520550.1 hypothetical protein G6F52_007560 [Rhizopus delemar]
MPSLTNREPITPTAPNDMTIAECYSRLENFLRQHSDIKQFKVEDDRHGMGMVSTLDPIYATNIRLNERTICNFMLNNGFQQDGDHILSRK